MQSTPSRSRNLIKNVNVMKKVFMFIVLCAMGLNAQSKLLPNIHASLNLGTTLVDNTLGLSDSKYVINKVLLYNKETTEQTVFENQAKNIDIDLDRLKTGAYTAMVYINGDVKVFNIDIVGLGLNETYDSSYAAEQAKPAKRDLSIAKTIEAVEAPVEVVEKKIKFYRIVSTVSYTYSLSRFNVFSEERKDILIRKNTLDLATSTGKKNTLVVYAVYLDKSEEVIYDTKAVKKFNETLPVNELSAL